MSNERIDEFLPWRGQLDDPEGIPGQGLDDREAAWERLMDKMAERPRRRLFGYRIVVACVLLAMVPAARFFYDRHSRVVAVRPVERQRVVAPGTLMPSPGPGNVATAHVEGANPGATAIPGMPGVVTPERRLREGAKPGRARREPAMQEQPLEIAGLAEPPAVLPAKIPDSAGAMPLKQLKQLKNKPLRVISINELPGGPGPSPAEVTASDVQRRFEFKLSSSN